MDKNHIQFVFEHVMARLDLMESGQVTDCEGLFDPELWNSVSPSEHRHVFVPPNIHVGGTGKVPLEFAGFNRARHNLYRKINKAVSISFSQEI